MDLGLQDKTVIVTGGGSNIGRGISLAFAGERCNVAIVEIDEEQGRKVACEAEAVGGRAICIRCDVTKWDQVQQMVREVLTAFGAIDILVNNVGWTYDRLFVEKPREEMEREVQLNFWSDINCIRAVLDHMVEKKGGAIVSIGSDAGRMGEFREAVYGGCKGAVIALSKSLARELGRYRIRVNVVCPGLTIPRSEAEMGQSSLWREMRHIFTPEAMERAKMAYPLRKLGTPEDIACAVLFLSSDRCAGHITGQTLSVSGGYTMM